MTFRELPAAARIHLLAVMIAGAAACAWSTRLGTFNRPWVLLILALASIAAHTLKIDLPLSTSSGTLSTGYAVGFATLLMFGTGPAVWMMAIGVFAQCWLSRTIRWYQTAFNVSTVVLSTLAAGLTLSATGGAVITAPADVVVPSIVAAALADFLVNTTLIATAIGLTSNQSPLRIWDRDFIWVAPNYLMGSLAATVGVEGVHRFGLTAIGLLVGPFLLIYRVYKASMSRFDEMSRANRELHVEVKRAQHESLTDPLTNLPNRRVLADHIGHEVARAERHGQPFALIVIDLDEFKSINDRYGHQRGDAALELVARTLKTMLRPYDICCRYAGDEFALVLASCPTDQAHIRAGEISARIDGLVFEAAPGATVQLRASAGVASYPDDGRTYPELFEAADARMYAQKTRRHSRAAL